MTQPIIALDYPSYAAAKNLLAVLPSPLYLKVGMELFYQEGVVLIESLKAQHHRIFLDIKLHDIPNTIKQTLRGLAQLNVDMITLHAMGGRRMMDAAKEGLACANTPYPLPLLVAVTQLTSLSEAEMQHDQQSTLSLIDSVLHYSTLAYQAGLDGVVCSAQELTRVKRATSSAFMCVTPGIRLDNQSNNDQMRVVTPQEAKQYGADYIVVGRAISQAVDPAKAYQTILRACRGDHNVSDSGC